MENKPDLDLYFHDRLASEIDKEAQNIKLISAQANDINEFQEQFVVADSFKNPALQHATMKSLFEAYNPGQLIKDFREIINNKKYMDNYEILGYLMNAIEKKLGELALASARATASEQEKLLALDEEYVKALEMLTNDTVSINEAYFTDKAKIEEESTLDKKILSEKIVAYQGLRDKIKPIFDTASVAWPIPIENFPIIESEIKPEDCELEQVRNKEALTCIRLANLLLENPGANFDLKTLGLTLYGDNPDQAVGNDYSYIRSIKQNVSAVLTNSRRQNGNSFLDEYVTKKGFEILFDEEYRKDNRGYIVKMRVVRAVPIKETSIETSL